VTQALKAAAWILLLAIFVVTDGPLNLRPTFGHPNAERFAALAILGFAFALAYPRRIPVVLALLVATVCLFEIVQHLVMYRHGTVRDVVVKLAGAIVGVACGMVLRMGEQKRE
jgi:glycopeptide antibiotics resistance protein